MLDYLANFVAKGDPNGKELPLWNRMSKRNKKVLCFRLDKTGMGKPSYLKLIRNMVTKGAPKA